MKAVIVTVYDSVNSGSYWQARALESAMESMGAEVAFLERRKDVGASSSFASVIMTMIKSMLKYGVGSALQYKHISDSFKVANLHNRIISEKEALSDLHNVFILGSDTIWNVAERYFARNWEIYWGKMFEGHTVFPYAASIGNTTKTEVQMRKGLEEVIHSWRCIGVRDEHTKNIIEELSGRHCELVCDPTLLFGQDYYAEKCGVESKSGFVFLYLFSKLDDKEAKSLIEFARGKNLRIVIGSSHVKPSYCDEIILNTPENFIRYMLAADYIVTDTYHGTVFSVNFNKNFIVLDRGKKKVYEFLETVRLSDRMKTGSRSFSSIFHESANYHQTNSIIDVLRQKSWDYLKMAMEM